MECLRCGNTNFDVIKTEKVGEVVRRTRRCASTNDGIYKGCDKIYFTDEAIWGIKVFNKSTLTSELITVKDYKERYLEYDLHREANPKQLRAFE